MPGFLAACLVDRPRRTGAVLLSNATTGLGPGGLAQTLVEELERCEPTLPPAWTPTATVPPGVCDALGVWHWGNTPCALWIDGALLVLGRGDDVWCRFELRADTIVGTTGYFAGETLHVVRREDGSVSHLVCATFVLTRTPYAVDPRDMTG
jgi:hypothetical protein